MPINVHHKRAGLLVPVFALRRQGDLGIGDTEAVKDAIDFCSGLGMGVLQTLPINETGGDHSPYNTISSVSLEPAYLTMTPEQVPGLTNEILERLAPEKKRADLNAGSVVYPEVKKLKNSLLAAAFEEFLQKDLESGSSLAGEFEFFVKEQARWLPAYTLFRALLVEYGGNPVWTQWEPQHRGYLAAEEWCLRSDKKEKIEHYRELTAYTQWVAFRQWRAVKAYADSKKVRLLGDIPFGISRYSADTWANPQLFDLEWSGGAPPERNFRSDEFTMKWGQNWGIPLYFWERHKEQNFAWWRQRILGVGQCFHGFRIDHALGFFRIYAFPWIPERNSEFLPLDWEQARAKNNGRVPQFLPGPDDHPESAQYNQKQGEYLLKVILQTAEELGMDVVAEDLGMVPNYVRPTLKRLGIPGFAIPVFDRDEATQEIRPMSNIPELSLATYTTHDFPPLATMYEEREKEYQNQSKEMARLERQRLMRMIGMDDSNPPTEFSRKVHIEFLRALFKSPSWLAVVIITDVLGTKQRFNTPGTAGQFNWSERLEKPLRDLERDSRYREVIEALREIIAQTNRRP
jgi:4-alpha-glucanotransferase